MALNKKWLLFIVLGIICALTLYVIIAEPFKKEITFNDGLLKLKAPFASNIKFDFIYDENSYVGEQAAFSDAKIKIGRAHV